jgi:hypothetical protein
MHDLHFVTREIFEEQVKARLAERLLGIPTRAALSLSAMISQYFIGGMMPELEWPTSDSR